MADRKWSELVDSSPQDSDGVALQRGTDNFRWTFLGLRTFLEGFFPTDTDLSDAVNTHDQDPTAHGGVETNFGTHTSGQVNSHVQVDAHISSTTIHVGASTAGAGLVHSNGVLNVVGGDGITSNANDVQVDSTVQRAIGGPTNGNVVQMDSSGLVTDGGVLVADLPTINRIDDPTGLIRMAVVVSLPGSPDSDTLYFVTG